jgi:hypothetical protein
MNSIWAYVEFPIELEISPLFIMHSSLFFNSNYVIEEAKIYTNEIIYSYAQELEIIAHFFFITMCIKIRSNIQSKCCLYSKIS